MKNDKLDGECYVDQKELVNRSSTPAQYDQVLMDILKNAGAPILGTFNMKPDKENYDWYFMHYPSKGKLFFRWRKAGGKRLQSK